MRVSRLRFGLTAVAVLVSASSAWAQANWKRTDDKQPVSVVYLVRHAEKADTGKDPELTPEGVERAKELARLLKDAGVTHIWSTGFKRTRATAAPLAATLRLAVETYDASNLLAFATKLKSIPGRHLVVGHSNTTPGLVEALGGTPGLPMSDDEYDRFYVVTLGQNIATVQLRFGVAPH